MATNGKYIYVDAENKPLFTKERYLKKDGSKGYAYSHVVDGNTVKTMPQFAGGTPLYNLHRIAKYPKQPVYFVEGEKCVDALTNHKILATTSGGATSDDKADLQPLAERTVILFADNDTAGISHMMRVKAKLVALGATVLEIDIDALCLPPKGDCVDWLVSFQRASNRTVTKADIEALPYKSDATEAQPSDYSEFVDAEVLLKSDDEVIEWLATFSQFEYDRVRKEKAKSLNVQLKTLDTLVRAQRDKSTLNDSPFADIEPWHEPVNFARLLDEITETILRFIVLDKHQAQSAALWVSACWFINEIKIAPFLLINAPEKACGKTQLLTLLGRLAPRTIQASGISQAAVYRTIEKYQPTLFIDEIETVLNDNEPLRGILNAGYSRDSSTIYRCVGEDHDSKPFNIWGMKAIAGINAIKLADTITSRSIVIELRRKTPNEKVERLRQAELDLFETIAKKLARLADDYHQDIKNARPYLPESLGDREQDNWEPLLQVAFVAGENWPSIAIDAALNLSNTTEEPQSTANELLEDIQEIFEFKKTIKIATSELINALCEDTEKSWATYNRGKQLTPRQLSKMLKLYGIESKTIRVDSYETAKGFEVKQFTDSFERYLNHPPNLPSQGNKSLEVNREAISRVTDNVTVTDSMGNKCDVVTDSENMGNRKVTLGSPPILGCDVVTDKTAFLGGIEKRNIKNDVARF